MKNASRYNNDHGSVKLMHKEIGALKVILLVELLGGLAMLAVFSLIMAAFGMDSPSSTSMDAILFGGTAFLIFAIPSALLLFLSNRELNKFRINGTIVFNIVTVIVVFFVFFPLALVQGYFLYKLKTVY